MNKRLILLGFLVLTYVSGFQMQLFSQEKGEDIILGKYKRFPFSMRGCFFLGETYREKGDIGKAEQFYLKVLEIDPDFEAAKKRLEILQKNKKKK
jgi:tetratricopeptide (TPR) repeat protein